MSKTGYTPIGIAGVNFPSTDRTKFSLVGFGISGTNAAVAIICNSATSIRFYPTVLYVKN